MRSIEEVLLRLTDQASCFVRIPRHRVMHVRVSAEVRQVALEVVMAMENHGLNQRPWLLVTDATEGPSRGWPARVERLRADHASRREAFAEAGHDMRELALPEGEGASMASLHGPVGAFGAMVRAYRHSLPEFLDGLVVVLAPTRAPVSAEWDAELSALLRNAALKDVRWVLVDEGEGDPLGMIELAGLVRRCSCRLDAAQVEQDTTTLLASFETRGGLGLARPEDYPPLRDEERRAGPAPESPEAHVTEAILTAAARVEQGQLARGIEWQIAACRRADALERPDLGVRCRLALAGYLKAANKDRSAAGQYAKAVDLAEQARLAGDDSLVTVEASARFALALSWWGARRPEDALAEFGRAGDLAERTGQVAIAIAAWRHAGQLARELGLNQQCIRAWCVAVKLGAANRDAGRVAGVEEIGRLLVEVCGETELDPESAAAVEALSAPAEPEEAES